MVNQARKEKNILSTNKMLVVRIAIREDTDQTASSEAVWSESALFVKAFLAGN